MPSANRNIKKKSNEILKKKNPSERVPLTDELRQYLKISPFVSVPNIIVTPLMKDGKPVIKNNNPVVKLPVSKNSILNGIFAKSTYKPKDIRDDDSKKAMFLSALDLVDMDTADRIKARSDEGLVSPTILEKLTSRKGKTKTVSFFKNNPVPLSSSLGKKILASGVGRCNNPKEEIDKYERHCRGAKLRNISNYSDADYPQVNAKKAILKPGQYVHKYSYGRRQRTIRKVELAVGLSSKSFPLLNSCRDCVVRVYKMTDDDVAREMQNLLNPSLLMDMKKKAEVPIVPPETRPSSCCWIASEPTAGPSKVTVKIAKPVVNLFDIRNSPSKAKYFR